MKMPNVIAEILQLLPWFTVEPEPEPEYQGEKKLPEPVRRRSYRPKPTMTPAGSVHPIPLKKFKEMEEGGVVIQVSEEQRQNWLHGEWEGAEGASFIGTAYASGGPISDCPYASGVYVPGVGWIDATDRKGNNCEDD